MPLEINHSNTMHYVITHLGYGQNKSDNSYRLLCVHCKHMLYDTNDVLYDTNDVLYDTNDMLYDTNDVLYDAGGTNLSNKSVIGT